MGNRATNHKKRQRERKKERERFAAIDDYQRLKAVFGDKVTILKA